MEKPTKRNYRSLINYIWNEKPIVRSEMTFLNPADDFVILSKEQDSPFHVRIEKMLQKSGKDWPKVNINENSFICGNYLLKYA